MIDGQSAEEAEPDRKGVDCFRAFFRYHLFAYDKTIWGKLRDPVFVLMTAISLIPISGICQAIFAFVFCIIDKTDEYQLIAYILTFKGTQYLSHGMIRIIIGFFTYMNCVTVPADVNGHSCDEAGPGMAGNFQVTFVLFAIPIVLVWTAFLLLPFSKEKGRSKLKTLEYHHGGVSKEAQRKGGYLWRLMIYDFITFCICMGAVGYVVSTRSSYDDWPVKHALFAAQIAYGYLSLPFFLFTIPFVQAVLTHAVPTGYDRQGRVQAFKKPKMPEVERPPRESLTDKFVSKAEIAEVVENIKALSMGAASGMLTQLQSGKDAVGAKMQGATGGQQLSPIVLGPPPVDGSSASGTV
jgi:hypothetical protein